MTKEEADIREVAFEILKVTITDEAHVSNIEMSRFILSGYFFTQDNEIKGLGKLASNNRYDRQ